MDATRLTLPAIGYGAFKIGRNRGIKYPDPYELPDDDDAETLLNRVLDRGITYIDTAPAYGLSEERIGRSIGHRNDEFVVSTKVGETFRDGRSMFDFTECGVTESVERSARRLRTDSIDLVFVHASHDDVNDISNTDVVPAIQRLRDRGLVRFIGLSGYTADAFRASFDWADAIMIEYNLVNRDNEPLIAEAAARGLAVVVKKGLASGHQPAADAVRFVLSNRNVTSLLVASLNVDHLRENLCVANSVRPLARRQDSPT